MKKDTTTKVQDKIDYLILLGKSFQLRDLNDWEEEDFYTLYKEDNYKVLCGDALAGVYKVIRTNMMKNLRNDDGGKLNLSFNEWLADDENAYVYVTSKEDMTEYGKDKFKCLSKYVMKRVVEERLAKFKEDGSIDHSQQVSKVLNGMTLDVKEFNRLGYLTDNEVEEYVNYLEMGLSSLEINREFDSKEFTDYLYPIMTSLNYETVLYGA